MSKTKNRTTKKMPKPVKAAKPLVCWAPVYRDNGEFHLGRSHNFRDPKVKPPDTFDKWNPSRTITYQLVRIVPLSNPSGRKAKVRK